MSKNGVLLIVSGPAGAGKGSICNELIRKYPDKYALSISATSRLPRGQEEDGREYFFRSRSEFEKMIEQDELLEYAEYVGNYYGTPKAWVNERLNSGINVILEIDLQGGFQIKSKVNDSIGIFILPPDVDELLNRLTGRATENISQIKGRLTRAIDEFGEAKDYDYIIINEDIEKSADLLHNIILMR